MKNQFPSPTGARIEFLLCGCGTIFQDKDIVPTIFDEDYISKLRASTKFFTDHALVYHRTYLPFIEENTYGRESLDIGFGIPEYIDNMRSRGWIAEGIDIVKNKFITGDFETYDFGTRDYDLVILSHSWESFNKPLDSLRKAVKLLRKGGFLWMSAPDTSLCLEIGYGQFEQFLPQNKCMTSMSRMILELQKLGMEPPMIQYQNQNKRYLYYNDFHIIAKKGLS